MISKAQQPERFEREHPHSIESEMLTLGSMLLAGVEKPDIIGDVAGILRGPQDFFLAKHAAIYAEVVSLYRERNSLDVPQVVSRMQRSGTLNESGGMDYLVELVESVPIADHGPHYAKEVADRAARRRLMQAADQLLSASSDLSRPVDQSISEASEAIHAAPQASTRNTAATRAEAMASVVAGLRSGERGEGVPTGFHGLDYRIGGLKRGKMYLVAGRAGMGKSALSTNIAERVSDQGIPAVVFSLEMNHDDIGLRMLAGDREVDSRTIERTKPDMTLELADYDDAVANAQAKDKRATLYLEDTPGLSLDQLAVKARRYVEGKGVGLVVVDYLGLMEPPKTENRTQQVAALSRGVMTLAGQLDVPFVVAHQLNRNLESRENKRPMLSDLRDAGELEQDAYGVIFVHRPVYYAIRDNPESGADPHRKEKAELVVGKIRGGHPGICDIRFRADITRFENPSEGEVPF